MAFTKDEEAAAAEFERQITLGDAKRSIEAHLARLITEGTVSVANLQQRLREHLTEIGLVSGYVTVDVGLGDGESIAAIIKVVLREEHVAADCIRYVADVDLRT